MSTRNDPVIISAARTAVGKAPRGSLRTTRADEMAVAAIQEAMNRVARLDGADLDDVILGCAFPEGTQGMNMARTAALRAGIPYTVPAMTINRFCSSGLQAMALAADRIRLGDADVIVAGGAESMSLVPLGGDRFLPNPDLLREMPDAYLNMGLTAELVAERYGIGREDQDRFAQASNEKAVAAVQGGRFRDEIVPLRIVIRGAGPGGSVTESEKLFDTDEGPRAESTYEALAGLKPAFKIGGTVTAGNTSQMSDGAAALLLSSAGRAEALGAKPLARFRGYAVAGVPPEVMGIGPVEAIPKLLAKTGLSIGDIDLFEINEAFAAQSLCIVRELNIPEERVNVNGGAIALGHPLGATGAKLATTLLYEMRRRGSRYGVVSMCIGGGMGAAGLFEMAGG